MEGMRDTILRRDQAALPLDASCSLCTVAMVAFGYDDCEGDLLERVRSLVGADCVIGASSIRIAILNTPQMRLRRHSSSCSGISAHRFSSREARRPVTLVLARSGAR